MPKFIHSFAIGLAALAFPAWASWDVLLRYFVGFVFLAAGLMMSRKDAPQAGPLDKLVLLGPVFLAAPMALFAADHFAEAQGISRGVPSWIPWHMFWTYFVGVATKSQEPKAKTRKLPSG